MRTPLSSLILTVAVVVSLCVGPLAGKNKLYIVFIIYIMHHEKKNSQEFSN